MQIELYKRAVVPLGKGVEVKYSLLSEEAAKTRPLGCELYGVQIEMGEEVAARPCLTASRVSVGALLDSMVSGGVTPAGMGDVVDDWLVAHN